MSFTTHHRHPPVGDRDDAERHRVLRQDHHEVVPLELNGTGELKFRRCRVFSLIKKTEK